MAFVNAGTTAAPPNPLAGTSTPVYGGGYGGPGGMYGGGMGGYGGGGMPGQYGTNYPLGAYGQNMVVTANLEHGQPIILDPETGQPLPPGVVPNIRDENQYYPYQPWEAAQEAQQYADAQSAKTMNDALKTVMEPWDNLRAEKIKQGAATKDAAITAGAGAIRKESEALIKDPQGYLTEKAKNLPSSLSGVFGGSDSKSGGGSSTKSSGGSRQMGSSGNLASDLGYQTGQGIKGIGGALEGLGKGLTDFGKGVGEGLGLGKGNPDRVGSTGLTNKQFGEYGQAVLNDDYRNKGKQISDAKIDKGFGLNPDLGFLNKTPSDGLRGSLNREVDWGFSGKLESNLQLNSGGGLPSRPSSTGGRPEMRRMEPRIR